MLCCPKCGSPLMRYDRVYRCEQNHSFDIAKRGYCNLLLGNRKATGDDKEMVRARTNFLKAGYYEPLRIKLLDILKEMKPETIIDAGCGEGYYTNEIAKRFPCSTVIGFDLSKTAVDEASKGKSGASYFVSSVFQLPLQDACADAVLSVFAPIKPSENARILKDDGFFMKVGPGTRHLQELKEVLYDDVYENEDKRFDLECFQLMKEEVLDYEIELQSQEEIRALFQMTPYFWKTSRDASNRLYMLDSLKTHVQFRIEIFRRNFREDIL